MQDFILTLIKKVLAPVLDHEPVILITGAALVLQLLNKVKPMVPASMSSVFDLLLTVVAMFATRSLVRPVGGVAAKVRPA